MKNIYKLLFLLCATFVLSCESIETELTPEAAPETTPDVEVESEITFSAAITSRATESAFETGDEISITAYEADGSIYAENVRYSYSNAIFSSTSPIEYSSADQQLAFRAIYPYVEMDSNKEVTFAVKTDQSSGSNYTLSDLMSSYTDYTTFTTPQLTFNHLLANVVVNITSTDIDMINVSATINAATVVEYNLGTLMSTTSSSVETITMASNGVNSYKAIIAPQTISAGESFCSININGSIYNFDFSSSVNILAGKEYTINATIFNGGIIFDTPIISGWEEGELPEDSDVPDGYIAIYTAEQLAMIGVEASYPLDGSYFLVNDLDLSSYSNWTPIGVDEDAPFSGVFNGNDKTISNLTINTDSYYAGLFGYATSVTISNITLESPQVKGTYSVGALCGRCTATEESPATFEYCAIEGGTFSGSLSGGSTSVGGVVGFSKYLTFTSCYNTGDLFVINSSVFVGGVCGYAYYSTLTSCYNTGDVSVSGSGLVGGVCGTSPYSNITSCYNTGDISGSAGNNGSVSVGGVSGSSSSYITSCYNTGDLSGSAGDDGLVYVGGVIAYIYNSTLTSCYNTGDVSGNAGDDGSATVGGVAGYSYSSTLTSCYYLPYASTTYTNTYGTADANLVSTMTSSAFISTLNTAADETHWTYDSNKINNSYPILTSIDYN